MTGMKITEMINSTITGAVGHGAGIRIGPMVNSTLSNSVVHSHQGIEVESAVNSILSNLIVYGNSAGFPNLSQEHAAEILKIHRESSSPRDFEDKVKRSGVGRWLSNQKFTDWANLGVNLGRLFS